jgi:hypothetical protein
MIEPIALFGIQFTLSLVAYSLAALWYVAASPPRFVWAICRADSCSEHSWRRLRSV